MANFACVAAVGPKGQLGENNDLPWPPGSIKGDMNFFKNITLSQIMFNNDGSIADVKPAASMANVVIMGRKTWESIPPKFRPLEERLNIIVSSSCIENIGTSVVVAKSFEEAIEHAQIHVSKTKGYIFIVGGSTIYERAVKSPDCTGVFLTEVSGPMKDGDVFFPMENLRSSYTSKNIDQIARDVIVHIKRKASNTISISIFGTNKSAIFGQGFYLLMDNSSNFSYFLEFLKLNFDEYNQLISNNKRVDWYGKIINECSSTIDRTNFFTPEFASFLSSKLCEQKYSNQYNIPLSKKQLLFNQTTRRTDSSFSLNPINIIDISENEQFMVVADVSGKFTILSLYNEIDILTQINMERECDKILFFTVEGSQRLFASIKNGPYAIFDLEVDYSEVYRSTASYNESSIIKNALSNYLITKTTAGLYSIDFCSENQETWFLTDQQMDSIYCPKSLNFMLALNYDGKVIRIESIEDSPRPDVVSERQLDFDFSSIQLVQLFEKHFICVKFVQGKSFIKIFSVDQNVFFNIVFERSFDFICYYFAENPANTDQIVFVTSTCQMFWLDLKMGIVIQEKRISAGINEISFSNDGNVIILLEDSGSVTFLSNGFMPCEDETRLLVYSDKNLPQNFSSHVLLVEKINEIPKAQPKAKKKREHVVVEEKSSKKIKIEEEINYLPFWCTAYSSNVFPYVPQVKDEVVYFPSPHAEFVRRNGRKLKESINFDHLIDDKKPFYEGIIDDLEYVPDDIVKCKINMRLMIGRKWTKIEFNYFFGINQPNFIALKSLYLHNQNVRFKSNETVKIRVPPCQNENGFVVEIKDEKSASTNFGMYKIVCNKKNITMNLSHWEMAKTRSFEEYIPDSIHEDDKIEIMDILKNVLEEEKWVPFRHPVDFSEYPEYYAVVPYPMCLELILKRLKNNFYRNNSSFLWDVKQINIDANIFNEPDSEIVVESESLVNYVEKEMKSKKIKH